MPFVPVSKSYGSSGPPISSYLPPGAINSMLLGRLDMPGGLYSGLSRSPLSSLGGYGYGLSSSSSFGLSSSSIGISSYGSSSSPKLGKRYGLGFNPTSEHSTQRVSRPPKFNHINAYSKPFDIPSSTIPRRPVSNRFATFNTEDIDVTTPRRPSRDETVETNSKSIQESQENEPEEKMATPGDISRDRDKSFGTIRRNRPVIRIQTHHLKENPYLVTEEKPKKPKKTAGEKMKEKWAIQSKKKKHSGYRPPSLTDIQAQQEVLRREIEARQAALMQRRAERKASITNESGSEVLTKSQEDEFFSNPEKIPRRKSTKKFLIVRQMSKENLAGSEGLLVSSDVIPIPISRSGSTAGLLPVEISIPEEQPNGKACDIVDMNNEDDDEVDFWATPALRSKRSTMIIRSYFKPIAETEVITDSADVGSIHEEDEENCDLEIESIMKAGKELEDAKLNEGAQQLKQMREIFAGAKLLGMDQDQEKGTEEAEQESFMDLKNKTVKKVKKKKSDTKNTTGAADTTTGGKTEPVLTEPSITAPPGTQAHANPLANETQSTAEPVISSTESAEKQMPLELSEAPETEAKSKCKPKPFQLPSDVKESPSPSPSKIAGKSGIFNKFDSNSNTPSPVGFRKPEFVKAKSPGSPKSEFVKPQSPFSSRPAFVKAKSPGSPKVFSPLASVSGIPKFDETTEAPVADKSDEGPVKADDSATATTKDADKSPQKTNAPEDSKPEMSPPRAKVNESAKQELSSPKTKTSAGTDDTKATKLKAVEPIKTSKAEDTTKSNKLNQLSKYTPSPVEKSKAEDIKAKPGMPKTSPENPKEGDKLFEGKSKVERGKVDKKLASEITKAEAGKMTDKSPSDKSKPEASKTEPEKVTEAKPTVVGKATPGKSTTEKVDTQKQPDEVKPQGPEKGEPLAPPATKDGPKVEVPKSKPNNDPLQKVKTAAKRTDSPARKPWEKPVEAKKVEPSIKVETPGTDKLAKDVMSSSANKTSDPKGITISDTKSMSAEVAAASKQPAELTDKHPTTGTVSTSVNENKEVSSSSLEKGSESKLDELKTNTTPTNTDRSSPLPASENQVETKPKTQDNKDATSKPSTAQSPVASKQTDNNTKKPPTKQIEKPKATPSSDKDGPMNKVTIGKNKKNAFGLQNRWNSREDKRNKTIDSSDSSESIVQLKTSVTFAQDEPEDMAQNSESKVPQSQQGDETTKTPVEKPGAKAPKGKKVNPKSKATDEKPAVLSSPVTSQTTVESTTEVETVQIVQSSEETSTTITSETTEESEMITTVVLPNPIVQGIIRDSLNRYSSEGSSGSVDGDSPPLTPKSSERDGSSSTTSSSTLSAGTSGSSRRMPSPPSDDSDEDQETIARRICPTKTRPKFRRYEVDDFQFLKVLGKGSFGKVLLAELKGTDCYFAIKCLKKDVVLEDDDVECTMIERKVLLMGSKHPYLCHLLCTFQTESHLFFVMEYLNGGDLMFHIQQTGRFTEDRSRFYGAEIVSGLKFLHKKGIIYRDLKLDNILLDFEGHVRIADFGMCKLQIYLDRTADTFCGTPDYMAPEIIKGLKYNQCVDWWAFGILLYEMLIGQSPFSGCDEDELFWSICNESVRYPRFLSRESKKILEQLLEKDSSKRLGSTGNPHGDVKEQPFFAPINWDKLERRELDPPFKPKLKHSLDVQYFDTTFTKEAPRLTPVDKEILRSMDQTQFDGFSYTNPHTTD